MKTFFALILTLASATSFAAAPAPTPSKQITKFEVLRAIAADTVGHAALKQLKGCEIVMTKAPNAQFDNFEIKGSCNEEPNEWTGGGIYLEIMIKGQYFGQHSGEVQSIEMMHAG